jgi:hypothetical protein
MPVEYHALGEVGAIFISFYIFTENLLEMTVISIMSPV